MSTSRALTGGARALLPTPSLGWLLVLALLLSGGPAVQAQTTTWNNEAGTFAWGTAGNWTNGVPAPAGTAVFGGLGNASPITFAGASVSTGTLSFTAGGYTFDQDGLITLNSLLQSGSGTNVINTRLTGSGTFASTVSGGTLSVRNTQAGANANQFAAANTFAVNAGATLNARFAGSISAANGTSALGAASLTLAGGTLQMSGVEVVGQGVTGVYYEATPLNFNNRDPQLENRGRAMALFNTLTPTALGDPNAGFSASVSNINFADTGGAPFGSVGFSPADNMYARWIGRLTITTGGTYTFATRSDDGSNVYINGTRVVANNFYQGQTTRTGNIDLAAGTYLLEADFYEAGGGAGITLGYSGPDNGTPTLTNGTTDFSSVLIPDAALTAFQGRAALGNAVTVTASSTITADGVLETIMGGLTVSANQSLTVNGPGMVRFASTTLSAGATPTYTVNTAGFGDVALGPVTNLNAGAATIVKQGGQNLILDSTTNPTVGGGLVYRVEGGRLVAVVDATANPLGDAGRVAFGGATGGAVLFRTRNVDVTLPGVGLDVQAPGTVELVSTTGAARTVTLGGTVVLGGGNTLTVEPIVPNMTLNLGGVVSGTGNITVQGGGTLGLTGANTYTGTTRAVSGGVIIGTSTSPFGNPAGSVVADAGGTVALQGGVSIASAPPVTVNGAGGGARPMAFGNISGNNSYGGGITVASDAAVRSLADTLTVTGPVAIGANTLTVGGAGNVVLTGAVGGTGGLTKADAGTVTLAGPNTFSGTITVNNGVLAVTHPSGLGSAAVNVPSAAGILRFDPGAGNTAGGTGTAVTVTGGRIEVATGTANLSAATISLSAAGSIPGLVEGFIIGPNVWDLTTPNPGQNITGGNTPRVRMAEISTVNQNPATGWSDNNLWVYTGQIRTNASGVLSFAEQVDDNTFVRVNGVQILNNTQWDVVTAGTTSGLQPDTYYDIEVRMFNGVGGAGPPGNVNGATGWSNTYGLGIADVDTGVSLDGGQYFIPGSGADPLGAARFRTLVPVATLAVSGGATLQAGQVTGGGIVTLTGAAATPGVFQLVNRPSATANTADVLALTGTTAAGRVDVGTNQTLTVNQLNVATGGTLTKAGPGVLRVTGTPAGGNTGALRVEAGSVGGTGSIPALVVANGGRVAAGNDALTGTLTVQGNTTLENGAGIDVGMPANGASAPNALNRLATTGQLVVSGGTITIRLFGNATSGYTLGVPVVFTVETHGSLSGTAPTVVVDTTGYTSSIGGIGGFTGTGVVNAGDIQVTLTPVVNPVPEPGSVMLVGAVGLAGGWFARRRLARRG